MTEKNLFIPLITEYYEAFKCGEKTYELRVAGKRWNAETCRIGRKVTLSKGYGKANRLYGTVVGFTVVDGTRLKDSHRKNLIKIYGTDDNDIALIDIKLEQDDDNR